MAIHALRLRRTLTTLSSFHHSLSFVPVITPALKIPAVTMPVSFLLQSSTVIPQSFISSSLLRWTQASLYSSKQYKLYREGDEITPDTVLFEGCDYNHWLITMDFPKDNPPSREEMIATYEQTCAKGLNISLEEAKKRMYACSTTTYQGFQAVMTEEESEKFRDIPGVVFILPDSYIDPVNKEYGGDKYENGVITPRPPPVQYSSRGRIRDRNRNADQSRYDRQGSPMSNRQGYPTYNQQGSMQVDGRNYRPPQNYSPQQNYGMPGQGPVQGDGRNYGPPQNYTPQQNDGIPGQGPMQGDGRNYGSLENYSQQQNHGMPGQGPMQGDGRNYRPLQNYSQQQNHGMPGQGPMQGDGRNYGPPQDGMPGQGERRDPMLRYNCPGGRDPYQTDGRGPMPSYPGNNYPQEQRNFPPRDQVNYSPPNQGDFRAINRNYAPTPGGSYEQTTNSSYGQNYSGHGEDHKFSPVDERNVQGEPRKYPPTGQGDQGSY